MNTYKIVYKNGKEIIEQAEDSLVLTKKYDLCTRENISTRLIQI